ncbi:MAG: Methyltransferase domain [Candidatus Parcubacteria bacterium]|jgi:2-polyprenyl-3-methyl-5-hydroxy-6-metoxy-1,4-benzoquinol methylase
MKDQDFYNKESAIYSAKRYPERATDYVQSFFKRRLAITCALLKKEIHARKGLQLLEIGCADGVVMKEVSKVMGESFASMTGIDTAAEMIVAARKLNQGENMSFFVRGEESRDARYDVIIEIGVANYADFDEELAYISEHLKADGICIFSIAGRGSLNERFDDKSGYKNFLTYQEYESKMCEVFKIEKIAPVGFRLPLIWRVPFAARIIQSVVETCFAPLASGLYHEKVYVLKK